MASSLPKGEIQLTSCGLAFRTQGNAHDKSPSPGPWSSALYQELEALELLVEVAGRAGDVDSAGDSALAVLDALYDADGFGALGTVGALGGIHCFLTVAGFGYFCHDDFP